MGNMSKRIAGMPEYVAARLPWRATLWAYARWLRFVARYARRVTMCSVTSLDALARLNFDLPLRTDSEALDSELDTAVDAFLDGNVAPRGEAARKYYRWLREDDKAMGILREWLRVQHWRCTITISVDRRVVDSYLRRHKDLFGRPLEPSSVAEVREYARVLKAANRQWQWRLRESKAHKIDVSGLGVQGMLPGPVVWVLTSTFACSGYIYASTYFTHFGIDPALYFTVPDYLGHSADKAGRAVLAPLGYIFGALKYSVRGPTIPRSFQKRDMRLRGMLLVVIFAMAVVTAPLAFVATPFGFYAFHLPLMSLPVLLYFQDRILPRYFRSGGFFPTMVAALMFFFVLMWGAAKGDIYRVENSDPLPFAIETEEQRYDEATHRVVGANGGHFFLLNDDGNIDIVPRGSIKYVRTRAEEGVEGRLREWLRKRLAMVFPGSEGGR